MQILPTSWATFYFELAIAPKVYNRFPLNFASMRVTNEYEKSENFSTIAIKLLEIFSKSHKGSHWKIGRAHV